MTLEGRTALVTGGAKRIGRAICQELADGGAHIVVHAHSSFEEAQDLADELGGHAVQADLADADAVAGLVASAADAAGGRIDHVINNASAFQRRRLAELTYEDVDAMMRLHAWAPLALARDAAAQGGSSVVNLLDTRITGHDPLHFAYHLSKQALGALTRTLARELAPVRVNGVAPGPVLPPTDGTDGDGSLDAAVEATLLGRTAEPAEIAHAVRFLLDAEYITGQILFVDGGRHART